MIDARYLMEVGMADEGSFCGMKPSVESANVDTRSS